MPATNGIWGTTTTTALDRLAMMQEVAFPGPVLTDANPTEQYGIQTIDAISAPVFGALGP